jgi:hypothetical protein
MYKIFYSALQLFVPFDKIHMKYQVCLLRGTVGQYPPPPQKKEGWGRGRKTENYYSQYHKTGTLTWFDTVPAEQQNFSLN